MNDDLDDAVKNICLMSLEQDISKEDFIQKVSNTYDMISVVEDTLAYRIKLHNEAMKRVFGINKE